MRYNVITSGDVRLRERDPQLCQSSAFVRQMRDQAYHSYSEWDGWRSLTGATNWILHATIGAGDARSHRSLHASLLREQVDQ